MRTKLRDYAISFENEQQAAAIHAILLAAGATSIEELACFIDVKNGAGFAIANNSGYWHSQSVRFFEGQSQQGLRTQLDYKGFLKLMAEPEPLAHLSEDGATLIEGELFYVACKVSSDKWELVIHVDREPIITSITPNHVVRTQPDTHKAFKYLELAEKWIKEQNRIKAVIGVIPGTTYFYRVDDNGIAITVGAEPDAKVTDFLTWQAFHFVTAAVKKYKDGQPKD